MSRKRSCKSSYLPSFSPKFPFYKAFESARTPFFVHTGFPSSARLAISSPLRLQNRSMDADLGEKHIIATRSLG